jgi:hypothetical protein
MHHDSNHYINPIHRDWKVEDVYKQLRMAREDAIQHCTRPSCNQCTHNHSNSSSHLVQPRRTK